MTERDQLQSEIELVKTLGNRIRMELGLDVFVDDVDTHYFGDMLVLPESGQCITYLAHHKTKIP